MTKKIYIDAGHGGSDTGASGNGLKEKDLTLKIARYCVDFLSKHYEGHSIKMSRSADTYPTLTERTNDANAWGADVFLSIHINAGGGSGFETHIYTSVGAQTIKLQTYIHNALTQVYKGFTNRGMKHSDFHVLRESHMPAILTENLFIDTVKDANFLKQESNLALIGQAHAVGLAKYLDLPFKNIPITPQTSEKLFHVQVGAFKDKANAEKLRADLAKDGYASFIVEE